MDVPKKYDGFNGFTKCGLILSHEQFWMSSNGELKLRKKTKYVLIDPETFREKRVRIQNISFVAIIAAISGNCTFLLFKLLC